MITPEEVPKQDLYNLDITIAEFCIPRLIALKQHISNDKADEEFCRDLDHIVWALTQIYNGYTVLPPLPRKELGFNSKSNVAFREDVEAGILLFAKRFQQLWW